MDDLEKALALVHSRSSLVPRFCIVLGSGLGGLVDSIEQPSTIPYQQIPGFPASHAAGHAGNLVLGLLQGVPVVVLAGRAHLYEGNSVAQSTFGIRVGRRLGAETLILSNAAGGLNPRLKKGDLVALDSHINFLFRTLPTTSSSLHGVGMLSRHSEIYSSELIQSASAEAVQLGFVLTTGTYLATLGPTYETRAEYRFFRKLGADMVGMSTVHEAMVAAQVGYRIAAFSVITNEARPDSPTKTTHEEVLDVAAIAQTRLLPLVKRLIARS